MASDAEMSHLKELDKFFSSMIDLVPVARFGFDQDILQKVRERKHSVVEKKLKTAEKQHMGAASRKILGRISIDSLNTVSSIWGWLQSKQAAASSSRNLPTSKNGESPSDAPQIEVLTQKQAGKKKSRNRKGKLNDHDREVLVNRLQKKLEDLRAKRSQKDKRFVRRLSKSEKKAQEKLAAFSSRRKKSGNKAKPVEGAEKMVAEEEPKPDAVVAYSKFDFAQNGAKRKLDQGPNEAQGVKRRRKFGGKDYKTLLAKVEQEERRLDELTARDPDRAASLQHNLKWQKALEKSQGLKIKDDKRMLKMNARKKEKEKERTQENWHKRRENVDTKVQKRQEKRTENLQRRSDEKRSRKIDKARKKGRFVLPK